MEAWDLLALWGMALVRGGVVFTRGAWFLGYRCGDGCGLDEGGARGRGEGPVSKLSTSRL